MRCAGSSPAFDTSQSGRPSATRRESRPSHEAVVGLGQARPRHRESRVGEARLAAIPPWRHWSASHPVTPDHLPPMLAPEYALGIAESACASRHVTLAKSSQWIRGIHGSGLPNGHRGPHDGRKPHDMGRILSINISPARTRSDPGKRRGAGRFTGSAGPQWAPPIRHRQRQRGTER